MGSVRAPSREFLVLADEIRGVIARTESIAASDPNLHRARARALALLWALHDEVEASARALGGVEQTPTSRLRPGE